MQTNPRTRGETTCFAIVTEIMRKKSVFAQPKNRVPARNADGAGEKYEIEHDESHFTVINEVFSGDFPHQCLPKPTVHE